MHTDILAGRHPHIGIANALALLFLLLLCSESIFGAEVVEIAAKEDATESAVRGKLDFIKQHGDLAISEIVLTGLTKTKPLIFESMLNVEEGELLSSFDARGFVQQVKEKSFIRAVDVKYAKRDRMVVIIVSLKEKLTVLPVPMIKSDDKETSFGFLVMDTNFMGRGNLVFAGGAYAENHWSLTSGYIDSSWLNNESSLLVIATGGKQTVENETATGVIYQKYKETSTMVMAKAGYTFWDKFIPSAQMIYQKCIIDDSYTGAVNPAPGAEYLGMGLQLKYEDLYFKKYFKKGLSGEVTYTHGHPLESNDDEYNHLRLNGRYSFELAHDSLLSISLASGTSNMPRALEHGVGGRTGFKTVSPMVVADDYLSFSSAYEFPLAELKWGTFTALAFYEAGRHKTDDIPWTQFSGPGVGLRLYLKGIDVPAFGFDYGYDVETEQGFVGFALGFSM